MYKNYPKWRIYLSIVLSLLILYSFYLAGAPVSVLPILGIFFILIILLRGPLYKKIDESIVRRFSFFEKLPSWGKRLLIIIIFLLVFMVLKQVLFYSFELAGIDLREMIMESVYQSINKEENRADEAFIKRYLEENIGIAAFGGKVFCAYDVLGEKREGIIINEYLWALCLEYYLKDENLKEGSGISLPVALAIEEQGQIVSHRIPRDGSYYGPDIREIFPKKYHVKIFPQAPDYLEYNQRAKRLSEETQKEAESYFK